MAPKFGTSGLRGLVTELTDPLVAGYVAAFLETRAGPSDGTLLIGRDLRASSPRIAAAVAGAATAAGLTPLDAGVLPTPALALAAAARGTGAVMVTGSHIPDDRNGLKFYRPEGEITKDDEAAIAAAFAPMDDVRPATPEADPAPYAAFRARYAEAFGPAALAGLKVGVYEHASAARDLLHDILGDLGAATVSLGRSDRFVPVDTEALDPETGERLATWAAGHGLDAIVSTDGDADRPMLADARGAVIPGDRLGPLTAAGLGARVVVTPVSSNSLVERMGFEVHRTRIGSPYVIAGMAAAGAGTGAGARVVGYEANGGFLLGFPARPTAAAGAGDAAPTGSSGAGLSEGSGGAASGGALSGEAASDGAALAPLPTRDSLLPLLVPLAAAAAAGRGIAELAAALPPRFTAADRLTGVAPDRAAALLAALDGDDAEAARAGVLGDLGAPASVDRTDGWRATFAGGAIVHLRPSGNAPEFRVYAEADDPARAGALVAGTLARLEARLTD